MLGTPDFYLGLIIIGLSYSLLVVYGMVSTFIIEKDTDFPLSLQDTLNK